MTDNRLLAVKNATSEAIDHLHSSLESCPDPDAEVTDPKGIKARRPCTLLNASTLLNLILYTLLSMGMVP